MASIEILLSAIAALLLIPSLVIFAQALFAWFPKKYDDVTPAEDMCIAVLIPAHNESSGIIATLASIKPQLKSTDRLLVVADNCSDDTADIAAANGAEVIKRHDLDKRGKGFALDFGVRYLAKSPPDVVVVIDADCILQADSLSLLATYALKTGRPVQALDLMYAKESDLKSRVAEFAWSVKNLVRPLGYANLGLPCQLMGTGMAFPWRLISDADIANGSIVEDMKLGIEFSKAGMPPIFYLGSQVTSYFPAVSEVQSGQRMRWEHGHIATILSEAPRLFAQGIAKRDINLLALAFDLSVPPLALLVTLLFGYAAATGIVLMLYDVGYVAFLVSLSGVALLSIAIAMAWLGWGRHIISFSAMLLVPVYVISKIPHYVRFLFKRQKAWNKTERD
ncbi:MAG TPA: glycosyltransferase family 2 protein [Methylotenera sp.]|nr:glycosyltransferase family 2 protein [Methylotenera sp.]